MVVYIYRLIDPRSKRTRYVGKTNNLRVRLKNHCQQKLGAVHYNTHCSRWIRELKDYGCRPLIEVLEETDENSWVAAEMRWIAHYKSLGEPLTNLTDGGEGLTNHPHTEETKKKLSYMFKGRPLPEWQKEHLRIINTGKKQSPETVAKRAESIRSRRAAKGPLARDPSVRRAKRHSEGASPMGSPEWKAKITVALKARYMSLTSDEKERLRQHGLKGSRGPRPNLKGRKLSDEHRAKLSAIHKERLSVLTPEQKLARMQAAHAACPTHQRIVP
jgi:hypothetical protein